MSSEQRWSTTFLCRSNQLEKSLQSITDYINKRKSGIMEEGQVELVKRMLFALILLF